MKREVALIVATAVLLLGISDSGNLMVPELVELFHCDECTGWADPRPFTVTVMSAVQKMLTVLPDDSEFRLLLYESGLIEE